MDNSIRKKLFENYSDTHQTLIQNDWDNCCQFLQKYFLVNYSSIFNTWIQAEDIEVLEIGCNNGAGATALKKLFPKMNYTGVDLSPKDIELAKERLPDSRMKFVCADSSEWCRRHPNKYDLIIFKAVMEHIPKDNLDYFLSSICSAVKKSNSTTQGGIVLADVPNMDWIYAPHERYMDLTHECGYTCESLEQLFCNYFDTTEIFFAENCYEYKKYERIHAVIRKFCRFILGGLMKGAEPYLEPNRLWSRSIIAVGRFGANK